MLVELQMDSDNTCHKVEMSLEQHSVSHFYALTYQTVIIFSM